MRSARRSGSVADLLRLVKIAFYWTIKTMAWPVTHSYVRMQVHGAGNVPKEKACIVVANHASYIDAIVLGSACPRRLNFLITRPIYRLFRLKWFYYMMGSIPLSADVPDPRALKHALQMLAVDEAVGIFPEGERMPGGSLGEGKSGVAFLAARSGVSVIPAAIIGAHRVMPVGANFPRPCPVQVVFGEVISFPPYTTRRPTREQLDLFADEVMSRIRDLLGEESPSVVAKKERAGSAGS